MKENKARQYLDNFPDVPDEVFLKARQIHKAFLLYDHKNHAYCTHCEEELVIGDNELIHKAQCRCSACGIRGKAIDITKNYKGVRDADIANATIFLAGEDGNLYVRCFCQRIRFMHGELRPERHTLETQRYVFTPEGVARFEIVPSYSRYGYGFYRYFERDNWIVNSRFALPNFHDTSTGYRVFHGYDEINLNEAIAKTWMKNCMISKLSGGASTLIYLNFFVRHQGAERLIKCGFVRDVENMLYSYKNLVKFVDWKQTEVTKMLGVNRAELRHIRENNIPLRTLRDAREAFPELPADKAVGHFNTFKVSCETLKRTLELVGREKLSKLVKYMSCQPCSLVIYRDYIENCHRLGYDLTSREILFPPHLDDAHDRAEAAIEAQRFEERLKAEKFDLKKANKLKKERRSLEFKYGDYLIRQPKDANEIIEEGKILRHCVGGYAERHLRGATTIMFLRRKSDPDKPFFTIEIDNDLEIVQCHGYRNEFENDKPGDVIELEEIYQNYLLELKHGKAQISA